MTGVDKQHLGTEIALETSAIAPGVTVRGVVALGQYIYTSRPKAKIVLDNSAELLVQDRTIYAENFYVGGRPQSAYNLGLIYRSKKFWSIYLDVSYYDDLYIDFNPNRRTEEAISYDRFGSDKVEEGSGLWENIIGQEKVDGALMVDLSITKSFKFGNTFLYISGRVNNMLNNRDFITGGFEQLRFDFEDKNVDRFPSRYYYAYGLTYFLNLTLRI